MSGRGLEYRPHEDGYLQLELRRYIRRNGSARECGPYWYFQYHEAVSARSSTSARPATQRVLLPPSEQSPRRNRLQPLPGSHIDTKGQHGMFALEARSREVSSRGGLPIKVSLPDVSSSQAASTKKVPNVRLPEGKAWSRVTKYAGSAIKREANGALQPARAPRLPSPAPIQAYLPMSNRRDLKGPQRGYLWPQQQPALRAHLPERQGRGCR